MQQYHKRIKQITDPPAGRRKRFEETLRCFEKYGENTASIR